MADDLDDEWWLSKEEQEKKDLSGDESDEEPVEKKRKVESTEVTEGTSSSSDSDENKEKEQPTEKKKKKKRKRKKISEMIANETPKPLEPSDLIKAMKTHFKEKLSPVELDEIKIKEKHFCTCNDLSHTPTSYMKTIIPKWKKVMGAMDKTQGSPLVLMVTSAAIRATELIRQLADFRGDNCKVAKLFAKHMKIEEQKKFLKSSVIHIGVGTPNRLQSLLDEGVLHLDQVKHMVMDWSWRDVKYRRLIDNKEIKPDLMKLLQTHLIPHAKRTKAKLALL